MKILPQRKPIAFLFSVFIIVSVACGSTSSGAQPSDTNGPASIIQPSATEQPSPTETEVPTPLAPSFPDPSAYGWGLVADGFNSPVLLTNARDGSGRLFVAEQGGRIWIIENGATLAEPFLDITSEVGSQDNEQGLLGLAFHPDYKNNGLFYVNYTDLNGDTVIAKFHVSGDPNIADASSEEALIQVDQPFPNHNGGNLVFGPDGYLWAGLGDGGSGGDPHGNGQSLDTMLGKLLRVDVNSGSLYGIPPDNPFAGGGGLPEIWAYGLRNPWRFSFDSATGDLYIADVGQDSWEEIDYLPAGTAGGSNFGWNFFEGTHPFQGTPSDGVQFISPVTEYQHGPGCSITGGYVYRGAALPAWQGVYIYGDFCSGEILGLLQHPDGTWESQLLYESGFNITSFGVDENGELYVVDRGGGIYMLQAQ